MSNNFLFVKSNYAPLRETNICLSFGMIRVLEIQKMNNA